MRILCVIPVRGGSKGLPRKNALEIYKGKSLLEWTIIQANKAFPHEDIIVSTEDNELSNIAKSVNAIVLDRPAKLAQDDTTTAAVVENILQHLDPDKKIYDAICILQVTSALRKNEDILESVNSFYAGTISRIDSVTSYPEMNSFCPSMRQGKIFAGE